MTRLEKVKKRLEQFRRHIEKLRIQRNVKSFEKKRIEMLEDFYN